MPDHSYYRLTADHYERLKQRDPTVAQYLWHGEYDWEDEDDGEWIMRIPHTRDTFTLRIELSDRITDDYRDTDTPRIMRSHSERMNSRYEDLCVDCGVAVTPTQTDNPTRCGPCDSALLQRAAQLNRIQQSKHTDSE